jgi:DNA repair protein RadC
MISTEKKDNSGHRDRLRKKFMESGLSGFHDYEIIEALLTLGTPRKDCKNTAKELLVKFKTLHRVFEAQPEELKSVKGIGEKNLFSLLLVKSAAEIFLKKKIIDKDILSCSEDVFNYLFYSMREKDIEFFKVLFLDSKNRVSDIENIHEGSISSSAVYPREVIKKAINKSASALIFAHNHPSGSVEPSAADKAVTRRLVHACLNIDIKVHEHLIIGDNKYFSFADQGYISKFTDEFFDLEKDIFNGK